jgi:hypothetical protein
MSARLDPWTGYVRLAHHLDARIGMIAGACALPRRLTGVRPAPGEARGDMTAWSGGGPVKVAGCKPPAARWWRDLSILRIFLFDAAERRQKCA